MKDEKRGKGQVKTRKVKNSPQSVNKITKNQKYLKT
jgi:hypothetical protein